MPQLQHKRTKPIEFDFVNPVRDQTPIAELGLSNLPQISFLWSRTKFVFLLWGVSAFALSGFFFGHSMSWLLGLVSGKRGKHVENSPKITPVVTAEYGTTE